ncbi:DUF4296 domain-containing protein [Riemerella columbina]|uniref:DUF4296 domain-containing protein n=1 Tax=Riemerella columbina TaxID=103810 RepID=UPI0003824B8A|nr:DUF4296 domain-containing protein [Riemerella columbina]
MKPILTLFLSVLLLLTNCKPPAKKPQHLLPKDKMASIVADYAIYNQALEVNRDADLEEISLYILKKNKITQKQFMESYRYYLNKPSDIDEIYDLSQDIILEKNKGLKDFINKKEAARKTSEKPESSKFKSQP